MMNNPKRTIAILSLITAASIITAIVLGMKLKALHDATPDQQAASSAAEIKKTVAEVGKNIVLPDNETPTMATVTDPSKLRDQPFFAQAQIGDVVLVYVNFHKAILWRPSIQKIIEVSPINLPGAAPAPTASSTKAR